MAFVAGALGTMRLWRAVRGKIQKPRHPGRSCSREKRRILWLRRNIPKEPCSKFLHDAMWKISQALQDVGFNRMLGPKTPKHRID